MTAQSKPREVPLREVTPVHAHGHAHPVPLANAATAVALVLYAACRIVSVIAPTFLVWLFEPWFHGVMLQPLIPAISAFQPAEFVIGLVTFGGTVWLTAYGFARLYNAWSRS